MTKVQEQCILLIVHGGGPLGRRARDQIEYAPLGLTIKVQPVPDKISGTKVSVVAVDDMVDSAAFWAAVRERMPINRKGQPERLAFPENFGGRKPRNVSCGDNRIQISTLPIKGKANG